MKKTTGGAQRPANRGKNGAHKDKRRPYYGVQDPDFTEGGGFGRHRDTVAGQSQEGSRNPSGRTVQPKVIAPSAKGDGNDQTRRADNPPELKK